MELVRKLRQRAEARNPIRVGIIGCGQMGSGVAHTINNIVGMSVCAIADIDVNRGVATFVEMGRAGEDIVVTDKQGEAEDAIQCGATVVTPDARLLPQLDAIDANVEATGVPDVGAAMAWDSIHHRKPIIMLNVETDVTVGLQLSCLARNVGAVYTVASGDEPGVLKMLHEQAILMGFEVICLGKCKNNPIDYNATPDACADDALSKDMNPKILASFLDGTKTMVELAAVSNATGLLPDVPGMHGPRVEVEGLLDTFIPKSDGGIFSRRGTVDFSTGGFAPGVFAIVYTDDKRIRKDMKFITRAEGPYYLHYRPYHLCDLETPQSIAEAVLFGEVTVAAENLHSEVVATAKRDLKEGDRLGGIGSADFYGTIYTYVDAKAHKAIPIGIADGGVVRTNLHKGDLLTEGNFAPDATTFIYRLRKMQDALLERESRGVRP